MKKNIIKTKQKVMLLTTLFSLVVIIGFGVLEYYSYQNQFKIEVEKLKKDVSNSYNYETNELKTFYNTRIKCNIRDDDVLDAFEMANTNKLYFEIQNRFEALKEENSYLKIMHFHSIKNKTILRVHNPKKYGDDLSSFRPIVKNTNKFLKNNFGLETGIHGTFFRIINPVFNKKNVHIGSMEFGVELKYIINKLTQYYSNDKYAFLMNKRNLGVYKNDDYSLFNNGKYLLADDNAFFRTIYKKLDMTNPYELIQKKDKLYIVIYSEKIKNYLEQDMGVLLASRDVTNIQERFYTQMTHTTLLIIILFLSFLAMLNFGFEKYIERLSVSNEKLNKKMKEVDMDRQLMDNYTISSHTDLNGVITNVNDAFCEISGYSKEELIGQSHRLVRDKETAKDIYEEIWSLLKAEQHWEGDIRNKRKDGTYYWVQLYITPEYDLNNIHIGYSAVRKDITIKKNIDT